MIIEFGIDPKIIMTVPPGQSAEEYVNKLAASGVELRTPLGVIVPLNDYLVRETRKDKELVNETTFSQG